MPRKARSYSDVGVYRLLYLCMKRPGYSSLQGRTIVIVNGEADWSGRPKPPEPPRDADLYEDSGDLNAFFKAQREESLYKQYWPQIPMKMFKRCVHRGYLEERGGAYHLTVEGEAFATRITREQMTTKWGRRGRVDPILSDYRRRKQQRVERGMLYLKWYGIDFLPRLGLDPKQERKLLHRYMSERRAAPPPPRPSGRRKGWGERLRQHEVDRKEKLSWD